MKVSSYGDVFCQSYQVGRGAGKPPPDKTYSAGVASDSIRLSDDVLPSVRRWLDDAELQLSAAAAARMRADNDVADYDVRSLLDGLCSHCDVSQVTVCIKLT